MANQWERMPDRGEANVGKQGKAALPHLRGGGTTHAAFRRYTVAVRVSQRRV